MNQEILDYVKSQRVCVLAVEMLDGSPHAATVHIANTENPLVFFFETSQDSRKSESLFGRESTRASLTPTWWRFTDWTRPEGKIILTSTDTDRK